MKNDNVGKCGHPKCAGGDGTHCFEKGKPMRTLEKIKIETKLDYLREQIEKECISYGEITELVSLKEYIPDDDVVLREWAGIPEYK